MDPNQLFSVLNLLAVCGWLLLVLAPRRRWATYGLAGSIALVLAVTYLMIIVTTFGDAPGGFSSLPDVALLFSRPWLLLAGWVHYLAFDLLVGSWELRDSQQRGIRHLLVVPCLLLTFMFGPIGWLAYIALRASRRAGVAANT